MKVLHVAFGRKYYVWALCDEDGTCQVMEKLKEVSRDHRDLVEPILALLNEVVPNEGPPLHDECRAKRVYRDIIYELKADKTQKRNHFGLRVLFFFSSLEPVVVCTNAFSKSGNTPPEELEIALRERARFYEEHDQLEFEETEP